MNTLDKIFNNTTNSPEEFAQQYTKYLSKLLQRLDSSSIAEFIEILLSAREDNRRIFFIGNGGSAATASHFANDIAIGTRCLDKPFNAVSLTDNIPVITAIANDDGYDEIFVQQLKTQFKSGDVVVAITASGNSKNIVKALQYAKSNDAVTVAILGFDGGTCRSLADTVIIAETPNGEYGPVEDIHMVLDHLIGAYLTRVVRS